MEKDHIEFLNEKYLIPYKGKIEISGLEDLMLVMAKNMEYALQEAGAEKEKDYKLLDLFELAKPFALDVFSKSNGKIDFANE